LGQSLVAFKRAQIDTRRVGKYVASLLVAAGALSLFFGMTTAAVGMQFRSTPVRELRSAMEALASVSPEAPAKRPRRVDVDELERAAPLSAATKRWLSGTDIFLYGCGAVAGVRGRRCHASLVFPNGRYYQFFISLPEHK
jgi:hypothetical protein